MSSQHQANQKLWYVFAVSSLAFLAVLAVSPFKDYFSEYRAYQEDFRNLMLQRASTRRQVEDAYNWQVGIRQIWIPHFGDAVDRCVSCHLGAENPEFDGAPSPFQFHPRTAHTPDDFERFGCVSCHRGRGRATTKLEAHGREEDWEQPLLPLRYTEASCGTCHRADEVPEAALLTAGRRLMEESGCYGCHELKGHEDWRSSAPPLDGLSEKTTVDWLRAWLGGPADVRPGTRMPDFQLQEDEIEALVAFLWTRPPKEDPSLDLTEGLPPGDYRRGRTLFRESRCISCHTVEGKGNGSASELSTIGSKVNRAWLVAFLSNPHAWDHNTPMPRYNFSREQTLDLSTYLMEEFAAYSEETQSQPLQMTPALISRGEELFRQYGCRGCHELAQAGSFPRIGPVLTGIGDKPVSMLDFGGRDDIPREPAAWLAAKVTNPRSFREGLKMPNYGFTAEEVSALVTALLSNTQGPIPADLMMERHVPNYQPPGRFGKLLSRYRCMSCHRIQGAGGDISKSDLTFEGSKVKERWLKEYLLLPATVRPLLTDRMLPLRMPEKEASFLADFIANVYVSNNIPEDLWAGDVPQDESINRGRRLFFERFGCNACHIVNNQGGYYGPLMNGLGDRLKAGWIYWWLHGPQRWRKDVRCPDFGMEDRDARDLAAFISSIAREGTDSSSSEGGKQ